MCKSMSLKRKQKIKEVVEEMSFESLNGITNILITENWLMSWLLRCGSLINTK